jgi:transposase-like protein
MVVNEVEGGSKIEDVRKKYDIGSPATIPKWVHQLGKNHLLNKIVRIETMEDKKQFRSVEEENIRLKIALANAKLANDCLEEVIRLADKELNTDLKKNFGDKLLKNSKPNTK